MNIDRRQMLGGMSLPCLFAAAPVLAKSKGRSVPLGLQSFTVMRKLEADFEGTLKLVASLGYRELETLGSFNRDPAYVRATLAKFGLSTPSQHMMPGDLYTYFQRDPKNPAEVAAMSKAFDGAFQTETADMFVTEATKRARALGQKYIVWQLGWRSRYTLADAERYAKAFNRAGKICADAGLQFAYHNHDHEFEAIEGKRPYDIFLEQTDVNLVKFEIDFMWATKAGADVVGLLRANPGRYRMCHLKDRTAANEIVTTGQGVEDFPALIEAAKAAGIEHYFFEFDRPSNPDQEIRKAANFLKPILSA